jgi:hypothetical protein
MRHANNISEGSTSRQILNGWKEISKYIERGVRTAQRWEAFLGMPVHRPALKDRSAVVAFSDELDRWISRTATDALDANDEASKDVLVRVHENMSALAWQTSQLASHTNALQEQLKRSRAIHRRRIASGMRTRAAAAANPSMGAVLPFRPRKGGD